MTEIPQLISDRQRLGLFDRSTDEYHSIMPKEARFEDGGRQIGARADRQFLAEERPLNGCCEAAV